MSDPPANPDQLIPQGRFAALFHLAKSPVKRRPRLTRARLSELLRYNQRTGEFRWRKESPHVDNDQLAGCLDRERRWVIWIGRRHYPAPQLAWLYMMGAWGRPMIDHRDCNPTNNRWSNLRLATPSQNNANRRRPRHNTSGFKGLSFHHQSGKWKATICKEGNTMCLGWFETPQSAHRAYVKAARKLFGEFARVE